MQISRALIVDDSRTAQHRLKKLLIRYRLEVDLATSAEEALGYLSYRMPSVIFMDHHMEGMDGFEALKIIKANPATATIPVIMYTSKSDDVYAGQAHALGALDTLSKNLMKPARIEEVLAKLNIYPKDTADAANAWHADGSASASGDSNKSDSEPEEARRDFATASELKAQIARLFELHIADMRNQSTENTKFIVRRLANEIKNAANQEHRIDDVPLSVINEEVRAESSKLALASNALLVLIFIALGAMSYQLFQAEQQTNDLKQSYHQLADLNYQSHLLLSDVISSKETSPPKSAPEQHYQGLLNILSWAMGIDMHFDYGEKPLEEAQIVTLQTLTYRLAEANFRGFVELDIRLGNFCLTQTEGGEWVLPERDTPVSECSFLKDQKIDLSADNYASVAYLQFEQTAAPIQSGQIEFILNVSAFENPHFPYPDLRPEVTAGQWNAVAAKNQQVVFSFERVGISP